MRKKSAPKSQKSSLKTLTLFIFIVSLFIIGSLLIKVFFAVRASRYDSNHRFTIGVIRPDTSLLEVLSFDPVGKSSVALTVQGRENNLSPQQIMGISFDGTITALGRADAKTLLISALLHQRGEKTTVSTIDLVRLILLLNGLPQTSQLSRTLVLPTDPVEIDKLSSSLFADPALSSEDASIQIINGTSEAGFGKRLERTLANMGANVVVVSTSQTALTNTKLVYFGPKTDTVKRLSQILHVTPKQGENKTIADIVIYLGESSSNTGEF